MDFEGRRKIAWNVQPFLPPLVAAAAAGGAQNLRNWMIVIEFVLIAAVDVRPWCCCSDWIANEYVGVHGDE